MQTCTISESKPTRQFPPFDLARLMRTVFNPKKGQSVCILIDLDDPSKIVNFAFLQDFDLALQRKAYTYFYRELRSGVLQQLALGGCDIYAFQTTKGNDTPLPDMVTSPDDKIYSLESDIYPVYDIFLAITTHSAMSSLGAAAKKHGFRGASLHGINHTVLRTGLAIDYSDVNVKTEKMRKGMTRAERIEIDFENDGVHHQLYIDLKGQEAQKSPVLCKFGTDIIQLPAGEVSFIPLGATGSFPIQLADGTLALAMVDKRRIHTLHLIRGDQATVDAWQSKLDRDPAIGTLIEFSFGTLELPYSGSPLQDEKILGSFHVGIGRSDPLILGQQKNALQETFLFSPDKNPEIHVKQLRMKRDGKIESLIENGEPAPYLQNLL